MEGVKVILLRNEHTQNGTHAPISGDNADENIAIIGGRWEESYRDLYGDGFSSRSGEMEEIVLKN